MKRARRLFAAAVAVAIGLLFVLPAMADEGMWTFDNPPRTLLKEKYGFEPTQEWLDHVRLASVRFNDGGSGSFVSANGLVLTNHHVALGQLQKVSTQEKDFVKNGFLARTAAEELKCPDLELNVLVSMEEVTGKVMAEVKAGMTEKEALDARKAAIAQITKESTEKTGLRSDIVAFYQGSEYWLYRYKKYTDIRLVMAPEQQIAFYGGDADNFTYPRYDLDMAFFRVYENDKPHQPRHFLKWNSAGAGENELVFVSGHPGSTDRQETLAQIEHERDYVYPMTLKRLKRMLVTLREYAARGPEQARRALNQIFGIENGLKALTGEYEGLLDKTLIAKLASDEKDFRERVDSNPEWKKDFGWTWDSVAAAIDRSRSMFHETSYRGLTGRLAGTALNIVRYVSEVKKPNGERLPQYQDANLESTRFRLFSPAPVYPDLEELQLADRLCESYEMLGANHPYVTAVLKGRAPREAAKDLVQGTKLAEVAVRKALIDGGEEAVKASTDSMIVVARAVVPMGDEMRKWTETNVSAITTTASEKIGRARFVVYGKTLSPDATFTLRLSYGTVKGYPMNGTKAPAWTTMYGLYDRAHSFPNDEAFALPQRFVDGVGKLTLTTPMNFVSTCDIIGGNSGSPVINKNAELVGLIFDGNIESLPGRFAYSEEKNRAVAVHPAAMIECIRKLYDAGALADELDGAAAQPGSAKDAAPVVPREKPKTVKKK